MDLIDEQGTENVYDREHQGVPGRDRAQQEPKRLYLFFRPLAQGTFDSLFGPEITVQERLVFFKQVLQGLATLHEHGFIHRDVKPGNLAIIDYSPPRAVIIDFGLAVRATKSGPGQVCTIPYMAPEVIEQREYDEQVDVWALGIVGYQLFISRGTQPWPRVDHATWERKVPVLFGHHGTSIKILIGEMLGWSAESRLSCKGAFQHRSLRDVDMGDHKVSDEEMSLEESSKRRRIESSSERLS